MFFFSSIWKKFLGLFFKRPLSTKNIILEEKAILANPISVDELYNKILETNDEIEKTNLFKKIAQQKTAKSIIEYAEAEDFKIKKEGVKKIYELHELRNELQALEEKKAILEFTKSQIKHADNPETSSFDSKIGNLFAILGNNKTDAKIELSEIWISANDKSFQQLEKLLQDKSALNKHKLRENEKQRQEELYKNQIKKKLSNLEDLINQSKTVEAKSLINVIEKSIKPHFEKEISRLQKAKEKLKEKELQIIKRQHEEILKKQEAEAQKIKVLQEIKFQERRLAIELEVAKQKLENDKKTDKERKLKALLNKKSNWRDFQKVLQDNKIKVLHHFTDYSNLRSIKENGGLYSWHYCDQNNIVIPMTGNSALGRNLDREFGLEDYVRLSFIEDHPMKHVALSEGRITKPYLLKVSIEVCYFENTKFSNMNAADRRHLNGDSVDFLKALNFDLFQKSYFNLNQIERKQYQAEVLVRTWIPAEFITNINEIA